jgi:hypothetical protein
MVVDQRLAVDDQGADVRGVAAVDQRLDGVVDGAEVHLLEVEHQQIGLCAGRQATQVVAAQGTRAAQRGRVEHLLWRADTKAAIGHAAHQGRVAHLSNQVLGVRIGAESDVDALLSIAGERLESDAHLQVLEGRVGDRCAAVGQALQVVGVGIVHPRVVVVEHAVAEQDVRAEEANAVQEFDRRFAVLAQDAMELEQVHGGVQGQPEAGFGCGPARRFQKIGRAGVQLGGHQDAADSAFVGSIMLLRELDRPLQGLFA